MRKLLIDGFGFELAEERFDSNPIHIAKSKGNNEKNEFKLIQCNKEVLEIGYVQDFFSPDLYIILSTHKSEAKMKSLSCHISGNWEKGIPPANPNVLRNVFVKLREMKEKYNLNEFAVTLEVTHHEPYELNAPSIWVEVGGTETEWNDLGGCKAVCDTVMSVEYANCALPTAVGFGGPHYAPNFMKDYVINSVAVGHICAKYAVDSAKEELIIEAFKKSSSMDKNKNLNECKLAILDWKGLSSEQRAKLIAIFERNGIKWKRIDEMKR